MATTDSPSKFVKPADLFRMRHSTNSSPAFEVQSPLKCLNNLTDPSPTKKLPTLLRNPFQNQPAKRRLNLGSPNKRTRMFEIDEDANLEPPKTKYPALDLGEQLQIEKKKSVCFKNDWILRTKFKISFDKQCKNWLDLSTSTHKRVENSPSKINDKTISIEAIKNIATVYQHPYLAWQQLYPRNSFNFEDKIKNSFALTKDMELAKMLRRDWCESLQDLSNLLLDGKCPYFYLCSDTYSILFKQIPSSNPKRPSVEAYISPFSNGMGLEFNKLEITFKCPEVTLNRSNSQDNMTSITNSFPNDSSSQATRNTSKGTSSIDSGNGTEFSDDEDFEEIENEDASQILSNWGIDLLLKPETRTFQETDSKNTQSKTSSESSSKSFALIEGRNNIRNLVKFLKTNERYTISNVGRFACIPPTLLSPREFRLSTPQYPEVISSKNMIETTLDNSATTSASDKSLTPVTPMKTPAKVVSGSSFVELKGTILPNFFKELHKLLIISDNMDNHTCQSTQLDSSIPFGSIQILP